MSALICRQLTIIVVILSLSCGQVYYNGTRQLALGSDKIVWSDDRYIGLYGKNVSFVADLQSDYDRFRNYLKSS